MKKICYIIIVFFALSCKTSQKTRAVKAPDKNVFSYVKIDTVSLAPKAMREFRAAWVATVSNINWPSKPGLPVDSQKKEAVALLDFLHKHNFNAVILQVRPQADALYKSDLEPWSYFLTGEQGKAPDPFYDPLEFWIEHAHDRGIELHVWLNPYRAHHPSGGAISDQSVIKKNPQLVSWLKEGYWWMDPSQKETQDRTTNVVRDLVKRYDIDGVHMDDYFYPYPSYNKNEDFPDSVSWTAYKNAGGNLSRGDWRRESVNTLIERLDKTIHEEKPHVKFGLSPFGIWRPGHPESVEGFDQYDVLFADAKLWLNKGWVDYFTPQLYWKISRIPQSFPVLLGWWESENTKARHLWPGINVGRDTSARTVDETINQIMITRAMVPKSKGVVHWSISSDVLNQNMAAGLIAGPYKKNAVVPQTPWLDDVKPSAPAFSLESLKDSTIRVNWQPADEKDAFRFIIYYLDGKTWNYVIANRNERSVLLKNYNGNGASKQPIRFIGVTAIDRMGNESNFSQKEILY